jgi:L-iditol 2-dehydrogenase
MSPIALPTQKAAVLYGPKDIRIDERTVWAPSMNQAQVSIASTGLCGSDRKWPNPTFVVT